MLTYTMDVEPHSLWLRTTPGEFTLSQPFCCTEAGLFYARSGFTTARTHKDSYLLFYIAAGEGRVRQGSSDVRLTPGTALLMNCRIPQSYGTASGQGRWTHFWIHVDGTGVAALENLLIPGGKLVPVQAAASASPSSPGRRTTSSPGSTSGKSTTTPAPKAHPSAPSG